jgi:prepilin-type N-terminal cleavage/methylation domain-containing protein
MLLVILAHKLVMEFPDMENKGLTITELLVAIFISAIILSAMGFLYSTSNKVFGQTEGIQNAKDYIDNGMTQLQWFFDRWGAGVPCNDPTGANNCTVVRPCQDSNGNFDFPPPSSICITYQQNQTYPNCDDVYFYGTMGGEGFVSKISSPSTVAVMSCRLNQAPNNNCYLVKRGGIWFRDYQNQNTVLFFQISGLSQNNLDCISSNSLSNATMSRTVNALNGQVYIQNGPTATPQLQNGDLLIRAPSLIHLYCQTNPQDGKLWLYAQTTDQSPCGNNKGPYALMPVNSFQVINDPYSDGYVEVRISFRGKDGKLITMDRIFGR